MTHQELWREGTAQLLAEIPTWPMDEIAGPRFWISTTLPPDLGGRVKMLALLGTQLTLMPGSLRERLREQAFLRSIRALDLEGPTRSKTSIRDQPLKADPQSRISGAVIAQNEEADLPDCLRSMAGLVDEMVVVDGGSTDATVDVARAHGAVVHQIPFLGDFAAQRNAAVARCNSEWILMLDADERLGPGLAELLVDVVRSGLADTVFLPFLNQYTHQHDPVNWPETHPRLFRNQLRWRNRVHEKVEGWTRPVHLPVNGPSVLHLKSLAAQGRSILRYAKINPTLHTQEEVAKWEQRLADPAWLAKYDG